jgi:hypothetical protein
VLGGTRSITQLAGVLAGFRWIALQQVTSSQRSRNTQDYYQPGHMGYSGIPQLVI